MSTEFSDTGDQSGRIKMKAGRNDPCPCGSGKKFKKCCGSADIQPPANLRHSAGQAAGANQAGAAIAQAIQAAMQHHQAGRLPQAEAMYQEILRVQPNNADVLHLLGLLFQQAGKSDIAANFMERSITANPRIPAFHNNFANALSAQGKLDQAIVHYERALALDQDFAEAHNNLANALSAQGKLDQAIVHYERALELKPDHAEAQNNLGNALFAQGKLGEAIAHCERALELRPDFAEAHNNLGNALSRQGKPVQAIAHYERALALKPDHVKAYSNLLLMLNYIPGCDAATVYARHLQFARQYEAPLAKFIQPHLNDRSPGRRLKIGYVSSDFRRHSVAHFIEPILQSHDRDRFQVFCYSNVGKTDEVTLRIQSYADVWRDILGMSDEMAARQIMGDRIDILVDLGGHTAANRLLIFARKPAPVQVTWLGYPNTTGLSAMDYRITDGLADPVGMTEDFHSEQLVRLPESFSCYHPPRECPDIAEPPSRKKGYVTYGSFNTFSKVTPEMMATWSEILKTVPDSRLTLKYNGLDDTALQKAVREMFATLGIDPERLALYGHSPSQRDHLEHYNGIDVGLDTFPYNGTTTTCDALWMGVPVVTLAGKTHVSRVGVSQMTNLGLTELIAQSPEEYISIAVRLAMDMERLNMLRSDLRSRMMASPLTNAPRLTKNLEQAYRAMWEKWRQGKSAS